ncbi:TCP-1/cpn60 chaperonin family protein [Candidatus Bathyarchaeota archaeon]|nr:TCP-1/cpn60 chaperonin family protein [Candidatus Bathyarchaeota archaeon]
MSMGQRLPILVLREGSRRSRGRDAQHSNIMAAKVIAQAVRSSLGPKGMDKMLVDDMGDVTITSDGRTILERVNVEHPAAKMMVEVAKTQDDEVGDGTTTSVVFAGELLSKAEDLIDRNIHPTTIIGGFRKASEKALEALERIAVQVDPADRDALRRVAMTSLASKIVSENKEQLAEITVEAVLLVAHTVGDEYRVDLDDIMVKKKPGESVVGTKLIRGIVLDKGFVHPDMPKRIEDARIALLNSPLEVEKTEFDARIHIESPEAMDEFLKEEESMLRRMAEKIASVGANVLICQKGIDDMAEYYLAKMGIAAVKRVKRSDLEKVAKATGGRIVVNLDDLRDDDLGFAGLVEERKIGDDKMVFIEGCKNPHSVTILIRGGTERIVDEAERSIHDALCVVRDVVQEPKILAGGGAPEMEVARKVRGYAESLPGREQLAARRFAEAIEIIPTTLAENAGLDPIDILSDLRAAHEKGGVWMGVDVLRGSVDDMMRLRVYEPLAVKKQVIKSATEAATMILKIDDVIAAGGSKSPPPPTSRGYGGLG